jgi:hypothetical protein
MTLLLVFERSLPTRSISASGRFALACVSALAAAIRANDAGSFAFVGTATDAEKIAIGEAGAHPPARSRARGRGRVSDRRIRRDLRRDTSRALAVSPRRRMSSGLNLAGVARGDR